MPAERLCEWEMSSRSLVTLEGVRTGRSGTNMIEARRPSDRIRFRIADGVECDQKPESRDDDTRLGRGDVTVDSPTPATHAAMHRTETTHSLGFVQDP
jgi:hypothetical protein